MKHILAPILLLTLLFPSLAYGETLRLVCEVTSMETRNQYLTKDLGLNLRSRFFELTFNDSYTKLETDMIAVYDKTVLGFEDRGSILEFTTKVDSTNWYNNFEINRYTGKITQVRVHSEDPKNIEIFIYECKSPRMKF